MTSLVVATNEASRGLPPDERRRRLAGLFLPAVAGAIHDRLLPEDLRGPGVAFEQKAEALSGRVREWTSALQASGHPRLEQVGRRIARCRPYGTGLTGKDRSSWIAGTPNGCGNRLCPNCFARHVHSACFSLGLSQAPLCVVAETLSVGSDARTICGMLKWARTRLRRHLFDPSGLHRCVLRCHLAWDPGRGPGHLFVAAVSSLIGERLLEHSAGTGLGREVLARDAGGLAAAARLVLWYWPRLLDTDFIQHLPRYLFAVGRTHEFM